MTGMLAGLFLLFSPVFVYGQAHEKSVVTLLAFYPGYDNRKIEVSNALVIDAKQGILAATAHGVLPNGRMTILFMDKSYEVETHKEWIDKNKDLAILKMKDGELADSLAVHFSTTIPFLGIRVIFAGNTCGAELFPKQFSFGGKVTDYMELISANGASRYQLKREPFTQYSVANFMVIAAKKKIVKGMSGSAIFDENLELVGMLSGVDKNQRKTAYAIPVYEIRKFLNSIKK